MTVVLGYVLLKSANALSIKRHMFLVRLVGIDARHGREY